MWKVYLGNGCTSHCGEPNCFRYIFINNEDDFCAGFWKEIGDDTNYYIDVIDFIPTTERVGNIYLRAKLLDRPHAGKTRWWILPEDLILRSNRGLLDLKDGGDQPTAGGAPQLWAIPNDFIIQFLKTRHRSMDLNTYYFCDLGQMVDLIHAQKLREVTIESFLTHPNQELRDFVKKCLAGETARLMS